MWPYPWLRRSRGDHSFAVVAVVVAVVVAAVVVVSCTLMIALPWHIPATAIKPLFPNG